MPPEQGRPPLPRSMRLRVWIVVVSGAFLALLALPLEVALVRDPDPDLGLLVAVFTVGLVLPLGFGLLMWWQVRRYRGDEEVRRRQPNTQAARILLVGNLGVVVVAQLVRGLLGGTGWLPATAGLAVLLGGVVAVFAVARRRDPRLHLFRRPDLSPHDPGADPGPPRGPAA